jgi:zinc D-Ala-D-Ala dipeptidase
VSLVGGRYVARVRSLVRVGAVLHIALVIGCAPPRAASTPPVETGELPVATDSLARALLTDVRGVDTTIRVELRYATSNNFTGAPLPGYSANRALLQREAAQALARVARDLRPHGLVLLVFDAYRPVRATEAMMRWTQRVGRADLVRDGYIANRSRHNLGAAIDLTLVDTTTGMPLDMGAPFDTFSAAAHTANAVAPVSGNRKRLVTAMERHGFVNYDKEWWHFSYPVTREVRMDLVIQ